MYFVSVSIVDGLRHYMCAVSLFAVEVLYQYKRVCAVSLSVIHFINIHVCMCC